MRIENTILNNLVFNEEYCRKVIPFLNKRYFSDRKESIIYDEIASFFEKYNKPVTKEILAIEISNRKDISDKEASDFQEHITKLQQVEETNLYLCLNTASLMKEEVLKQKEEMRKMKNHNQMK